MAVANLAIKSFRNRKLTVLLTIFSIALSVALLLAIEKIRVQAKDSFTSTIAGTDLIVGARTSSVNLLLSSVFQMGTATNAIKYGSFADISNNRMVSWAIPFALGDSHQGYKVIGTNTNFFKHYQYGRKQHLEHREGAWFTDEHDVVLGFEVAKKLGYQLNDNIVLAHGSGASYIHHEQQPFNVTGILKPTSTPLDRSLFISLAGVESLHEQDKKRAAGYDPFALLNTAAKERDHKNHAVEQHNDQHNENSEDLHSSDTISGFYLSLVDRSYVLSIMQQVNKYQAEPLMAIMPGVALLELWQMLSVVEQTLFSVSILVVIISLASMLIILLNSLHQRRREMAILRAVGARPSHIFSLMMGEAIAIILSGLCLGIMCLYAILFAAKPFVLSSFGIYLQLSLPSAQEWLLVTVVGIAGVIISLLPSIQVYRYALSDGMSVRN